MTEHLTFDQYPKSARLLFAARKAKAQDKEVTADNQVIRERRARAEDLKGLQTYPEDNDPLEDV